MSGQEDEGCMQRLSLAGATRLMIVRQTVWRGSMEGLRRGVEAFLLIVDE